MVAHDLRRQEKSKDNPETKEYQETYEENTVSGETGKKITRRHRSSKGFFGPDIWMVDAYPDY